MTSATVGGTTTNLSYDPLTRLIQVPGTSYTTQFAYDGLDMIAEYYSGTLVGRHVFDPATGQPLVTYLSGDTSTRMFLSPDERGSIMANTNNAGSLSYGNPYDEYGQPMSWNQYRYQYTGQAWLSEVPGLKLYYYKARMYSPVLGRFMQADPIGYGPSPNLYAYVLNDPVNLVDPLGLGSCPPGTTVCGKPPPKPPTGGTPCPKGWSCFAPSSNPLEPPTVELPEPAKSLPVDKEGDEKPKPTPNQCRLYSLQKNGLALGLDIAGILVEGLLAEVSVPASVITTSVIGVAGIGNSIAHKDWAGLGLAYGGRHAGMAEGFFTGRALKVARFLSIGALAVSTVRDLQAAKADYEKCGKEGP